MNDLVLILEVAGRRVALRASDVHSVVELENVRPVPRAPSHVLGLTALRSNTLTVIDTAATAGVSQRRALEDGERSAIVDHGGHRYALVVDAIDDVAEALSVAGPVPGEMGSGWARVAEGLIETDRGPALLLSIDELVAGPTALAA